MRRAVAVPTFMLAACGPSVQNLRTISPELPGDAYTCMMRALSEDGWQVLSADREAGFISAEKSRSSAGAAALGGAEFFTTASIIVLQADDGAEIRIVARPSKQEGGGSRSSRGLVLPESAQEDVRALASQCGDVADQQ